MNSRFDFRVVGTATGLWTGRSGVSVVGTATGLWTGRSGVRIPAGEINFSLNHPDRLWDPLWLFTRE
jgi:hypothetical protein